MGAVRPLPVMPFFVLLAIDVFNGVFALVAEGPATQAALVLKLIVLSYLARAILWTEHLASFVLAVTALLVVYVGLVEIERESILLFLKSAATLVLVLLLQRYAKAVEPRALTRFLRIALLVIASSLLLGLLGVGHERYGDSEALLPANGFLPAGNEINIALIGIFWWLTSLRRAGHRERADTALYGLCIALLVLSSSKTTMAGAIVIALYHARLRLGTMVLLGITLVGGVWLMVHSVIWERWTYFFYFYLDEGILSALTNGRFGRVADLIDNWRDLPWLGLGVLASGGGYIESDPLDLVLNFGVLGAVLFALWARVVWRLCHARWVPWLLLIGASTMAGHVIYSVFAAPLLVAAFTAHPMYRPATRRRRIRTKALLRMSNNKSPVEEVVFCGHTFRGLSKQRLLESSGTFTFIVTVNADFLVTAEQCPRFARLIDRGHATFDGQITWWLARWLAKPQGVFFEKISGSSFASDLLARAAATGERVFLLGARPEVNEAAVLQAKARFGVMVQGYSPPVFAYPADASLNEDILSRIADFRPQVLLVAFGSPKQEFWIDDHRQALESLGVRVAMGCGGTLDFLSGSLTRAPVFVQRCGLEGLYRLLQEPNLMRLKRLLRSTLVIPIALGWYRNPANKTSRAQS